MPLKGTPTWRLHTKPYKFGKNVFRNISHMKYLTDLILGEAFCIFIFFHFPDSGLSVFNGLHERLDSSHERGDVGYSKFLVNK